MSMAITQLSHPSPLSSFLPSYFSPSPLPRPRLPYNSTPDKRSRTRVASLKLGIEQISALANNKVLVAATIASAIGQLAKPFTSAMSREGVDLKAAIRSGGMPSTHSAGVVAVATSLGLERGFSDAIFGMSVVFAAIIMYDAQGVRKEVGDHAKILNRRLTLSENSIDHSKEGNNLVNSNAEFCTVSSARAASLVSVGEKAILNEANAGQPKNSTPGIQSSSVNPIEISEVGITELQQKAYTSYFPLNESVGHTTLQVVAGGALGFIASVVVYLTL